MHWLLLVALVGQIDCIRGNHRETVTFDSSGRAIVRETELNPYAPIPNPIGLTATDLMVQKKAISNHHTPNVYYKPGYGMRGLDTYRALPSSNPYLSPWRWYPDGTYRIKIQ